MSAQKVGSSSEKIEIDTDDSHSNNVSNSGDEQLGMKIREIRGLKGWTLKQAAEMHTPVKSHT